MNRNRGPNREFKKQFEKEFNEEFNYYWWSGIIRDSLIKGITPSSCESYSLKVDLTTDSIVSSFMVDVQINYIPSKTECLEIQQARIWEN